jgi:hypothetical protein
MKSVGKGTILSVIESKNETKKTNVSELYRQSGRRLSAKLVPTFADRECHVVSRILGFLDRLPVISYLIKHCAIRVGE